jgi:molybdenum cofactor cytidylyltransferase
MTDGQDRRTPVSAVLLAAGESRRMGAANKLLLEIDGRPMVRRAAETLLASAAGEVVVVLGHEGAAVSAALDGLAIRTVTNPDYRDGQMTSVRAGVSALRDPWRGVLVCLGDQPALTAADVDFMIESFQASTGDRILVPTYRGARGNPVLLPAVFRPDLVQGGMNVGCRQLIDRNPEREQTIEAPNPHFTTDVDTPDAYAALG